MTRHVVGELSPEGKRRWDGVQWKPLKPVVLVAAKPTHVDRPVQSAFLTRDRAGWEIAVFASFAWLILPITVWLKPYRLPVKIALTIGYFFALWAFIQLRLMLIQHLVSTG